MKAILLAARTRTGLSQVALAGVVKCAPSTIALLELGQRRPSLELLAKLRVALGLSDEDVGKILTDCLAPDDTARILRAALARVRRARAA